MMGTDGEGGGPEGAGEVGVRPTGNRSQIETFLQDSRE